MLALKRLSDAVRDGDRVHAVLVGWDNAHIGKGAGYAVPNANAQKRVIGRALERAKRAPSAVQFVEAHGTGTALGDPIEAEAFRLAFGEREPVVDDRHIALAHARKLDAGAVDDETPHLHVRQHGEAHHRHDRAG